MSRVRISFIFQARLPLNLIYENNSESLDNIYFTSIKAVANDNLKYIPFLSVSFLCKRRDFPYANIVIIRLTAKHFYFPMHFYV